MKKFTFLIAVFCCSFISTNAQLDVGVIDLPNLYNNIPVYSNVPTLVRYTRQNFGASVSSADVDSFTMEILVDQIKRQTFYRNMNGPAFGVNATETRTGANSLDWGQLGLAGGNTYAACVRTRLWKGGVLVDGNALNDEFCYKVDYQSGPFTFDATVENISLNGTPEYLPADFIPIPTFPDTLEFDLKNAGTTDLIQGLPISFELTIAGGSPIAVGPIPLGTSVSTPGSTPIKVNGLLGAGVTLPMTAGPFDVCVKLTMNGDNNGSNDNVCATFNMGNPIGIEQNEYDTFGKVFYDGSNLQAQFNDVATGIARIDLFEISGRKVSSYELNVDLNKNHSINMNDLSTGVYIVNISVNGEVLPYKFSVN